jgi:hypothetical protein
MGPPAGHTENTLPLQYCAFQRENPPAHPSHGMSCSDAYSVAARGVRPWDA